MKPPINDPNRNDPNRSTSGATGTSSPQPPSGPAAKSEPTSKTEPTSKGEPAKPIDPVAASAKPPLPPGAGTPGVAISQPVKPDTLKTGTTATEPPKVGPPKVEPVKDIPSAPKAGPSAASPVKPDLPRPDLGKADAAKPDISKTEPTKVGTPDLVKGAGTESGRTDAPKPDLTKSETPKPDATKGEAPRTEPPKATGFTPGSRNTDVSADGPIIDLKARRIPDPAETARREAAEKASPTPSATGPKTASSAPSSASPSSASASSSDAKARPSDPQSAAPQSNSGGAGFGSIAAAGLLGGVLGAGLLFAVERAGVLPSPTDDLAGRLTALDGTVGTLASRDALASLDTRVAGNEAALKPLPEAVRKAEAAAREALEKTGAAPGPAATADAATPAAAAALPADLVTRLDALDQRVAALQEEPGRDQTVDARVPLSQGSAPPDQIAKLDERLAALEGKIESAPKPADAPDPNAGLGARLTSIQSEIESRTKANAEADQALTQKLTALQASLDERVKAATEAVQTATEASRQSVEANKTQAEEAAKAVARQIQAQTDRIAGLDKAVSERAETGTVQAALRVVSADRIATALSTGAPYSDALTSLRNLEPGDPARLTAVAVFADKGAPTAPSLAAEFRAIAERIAASGKAAQARTVAESGDISQRFMSMAESIIQVRKVDAPVAEKAQGADPVVEIQAALDRGAIAEAAKSFAALPEPLRAEAGEFGTKLASRAAAGEAAQGLLSDAFKGLSVPAPTRPAPAR